MVRGLTIMTNKQLAAVSHLLPPGTIEAVGLAARLPRSNQVGHATGKACHSHSPYLAPRMRA